MAKNSFILFQEFEEVFNLLTDEDSAALIKAIFAYNAGKEIKLNYHLNVIFALIKKRLDDNQKNYDEVCRKNQENGKKGGAPRGNANAKKQPKTTENNRNNPKQHDNDNDNDNDNEYDHEYDNDNEENTLKEKEKNKKEKEKIVEEGFLCKEKENSFLISQKANNTILSSSKINPDLMFDSDINKVFEIYKKECKTLAPLNYETRDIALRGKIKEFLGIIRGDFAYFTEVCKKANDLKVIVNRKIDIQSVINNHARIYSGFYLTQNNEDYSKDTLLEMAKRVQCEYERENTS